MEWIFFAVGVVVIGVIGIALGLVLGRAVARRAARREGAGSDSFMTPVGPAGGGDEDVAPGGDDESSPDATASGDAVDGGERD